jgi:hypothetical protein
MQKKQAPCVLVICLLKKENNLYTYKNDKYIIQFILHCFTLSVLWKDII